MVVSRFMQAQNGKRYLEVDGRPFLFQSVQVMYAAERKIAELWLEKAKNVGYRLISPWVYWRNLEPLEGETCFDDIVLLIDAAVKYDMRLDLIWGGTNFCGRIDPRFAPEWVLRNPSFLFCGEDGCPVTVNGGDMGDSVVANVCNEQLLVSEQRILKALISFLEKYDITHRVISIQLGNEINMCGYTAGKKETLKYYDSLAEVVALHNYQIAARITLSDWLRTGIDQEICNYGNIKAFGMATLSPKVSYTRQMIESYQSDDFKHICCNNAFDNTSSHIVSTLAAGGFYHIYRLDYDSVWDIPSVYGEDWQETMATLQIRNLNSALNKAGALIASASPEEIVQFNTEQDGFPDMFYFNSKPLESIEIGFVSKYNFACGMAVYSDGYYYLFSDGNVEFYINKPAEKCENGYFDANGEFCVLNNIYTSEYDGKYYIGYRIGQCLRIKPSAL